jgi:HKD family nuclease
MSITINTNLTMQGIAEVLQEHLISCSSFNIVTAFIDSYSIDLIENCLKKNKALKNCKVLIGVYNCFNKREDLEHLHNISKKYANKIEIHISKCYEFHWKYYEFTKNRTTTSYIGSANFTNAGQNTNAEILVGIKNSKELNNAFEKQWKLSASISEFRIDKYTQTQIRSSNKNKLPNEIKSFFDVNDSQLDVIEKTTKSEKVVITYLELEMSKKEESAVVKYKSSWDKKKFFSCCDKAHHDKCVQFKNLLIIEKKKGMLKMYEAIAIDYSGKIKTNGMNYYIAYKSNGRPMKINEERKELLNTLNLNIIKRGAKYRYKTTNNNKIKKLLG